MTESIGDKGLKCDIDELMGRIDTVTNLCYKQKEKEAFSEMIALTDAVMALVEKLYIYKQQKQEYTFDTDRLLTVLGELMKAMEEKDMTMLADILEYELKEILGQINCGE